MKNYFVCMLSLCALLFINTYKVYAGCGGVCLYKNYAGSYNRAISDTIYAGSGTVKIYAVYNQSCRSLKFDTLIWFRNGIAIDTTSASDADFDGVGIYTTPFEVSLPGIYTVGLKRFPTSTGAGCGQITVLMGAQTSIDPVSGFNEELLVFPNPSLDGHFVVNLPSEAGEYTMQVYNTLGEMVIDMRRANDKLEFSLSNFTNGMYYAKLTNNSGKCLSKKIFLSQ